MEIRKNVEDEQEAKYQVPFGSPATQQWHRLQKAKENNEGNGVAEPWKLC